MKYHLGSFAIEQGYPEVLARLLELIEVIL